MILVCPSCEAKFKVPDGAIPPEGRTVRCAKCKHSWRAYPDQLLRKPVAAPPATPARPAPISPALAGVPDADMDAGLAARAAAVRRSVRGEVEGDVPAPAPMDEDIYDDDGDIRSDISPVRDSEGASDDFGIAKALGKSFGNDFDIDDDDENEPRSGDGLGSDAVDDDYDEDDFLARRRSEQRRQAQREASARKRKFITVGWALLVIFWLCVLYLLVFKKEEVVHNMPGMSGFYELFEGVEDIERFQPEEGEPLSQPLGEIEVYVTAKLHNDRTRVEDVDGRNTLMVRGFVQNMSMQSSATVPKVKVDVLDKDGRILQSWVADPPGRILRRQGVLNFETSLYPIPSGASNVAVKVIEGSRSDAEARTIE